MIYFFTPYSFRKKLFEAYDSYMLLIPELDDWGCLMDGDMAFLLSDFGHQIQEYIYKFQDTGLFTCYASRCPYGHQVKPGINQSSDSVKYIYENTKRMYDEDHLKVSPIKQRIAGHLMVIRKATWMKYRDEIRAHAENANIQAVDTAISDILLKHNEKIVLMNGLQVFHYYRQFSMSEKHILSDKLTVVIRTHDRPMAFKRCIESVRKQTHKNIDIIVGVDTEASYAYAVEYKPTQIIKMQGRARKSHEDFPANEYISTLIDPITDGYILVLDDDNFIADPRGVEKLFARITKEYCIYMIRYRYPDGRLFPNDRQFQNKLVENGGVDWASCVFHARFKHVSKSLPLYNGDFHFIKALVDKVRTTEFINLDLVHTDTPGNDGKTELQKPVQPKIKTTPKPKAKGEIDVVYVLGTGSKWRNNEIRFSLRSLEKNLIGYRNVVVVGEKPDFIQNVIHIPAQDVFDPSQNADGNIIGKVLLACADERVSDDFLFINDDHIILQPVKVDDIPAFHKGDMKHYAPEFWTVNVWRKRLKRTMLTLSEMDLPTLNFDCHTPILFNKTRFTEIMAGFDYASGIGLTMKSLYGNLEYANDCEFVMDQKKTIFTGYSFKGIVNRLAFAEFMAFNDTGLNDSMIYWLWKNFEEQSDFEQTDIDDRVIEISKWMEGDKDYQTGVSLYRKYEHGKNMLKLFEGGETETLRNKLEFRLKMAYNDIRGN